MPELGTLGSVRGALSNERPYRDKVLYPGRRRRSLSGRQYGPARYRERPSGPAWSKTLAWAEAPCTGTGRSLARPWRVLPRRTASGRRGAIADDERAGEVRPRRSSREPDEQGGAIRRGAGGAKGGAEGNAGQQSAFRAQYRATRVTGAGAHTASRKAREEGEVHRAPPPYQPRPPEGFFELKKNAAAGVDGPTWKDYEAGYERKLADLHAQVQRGAYRRNRAGGFTSPSRTGDSARWRSPPWRTRSSNGLRSRC